MKIAATGQPGQQLEIASKTLPRETEWIWVDSIPALAQQENVDLYIDLTFSMQEERIRELGGLPGPVLINSVTHTVAEICAAAPAPQSHSGSSPRRHPSPHQHPLCRFARTNGWPGFLTGNLWELAAADETTGACVRDLLTAAGQSCRMVPDIPGMIGARILCSLINEAYYTLQDQVSTREEIDTAMKLGTNYPLGPFEWGSKIGLPAIYELLQTLSRTNRRYTPAQALELESARLKSD
ncbi:MAG: 3-hydroxyacyl-CoA dehydrogenase family protein [Bacteroidota bacterium]|nr:3-hydroxyacyl-CoA dehydrogenase family protein [Bacteroidota bacterium]